MPGPEEIADGASDAEVIASSLRFSDAFGMLFERHFDEIHRYLARRVGRERANDLASQTFIVAFERRDAFRPDVLTALPWLLGIATRLLLNERRSERRLLRAIARLGSEQDAEAVDPEGLAGELDTDLAGALAGLDGDQRDALLLMAWGELSYDEIAVAMSIPIGTVKSRLSRARAHLRAKLDPPPGFPVMPTSDSEEA